MRPLTTPGRFPEFFEPWPDDVFRYKAPPVSMLIPAPDRTTVGVTVDRWLEPDYMRRDRWRVCQLRVETSETATRWAFDLEIERDAVEMYDQDPDELHRRRLSNQPGYVAPSEDGMYGTALALVASIRIRDHFTYRPPTGAEFFAWLWRQAEPLVLRSFRDVVERHGARALRPFRPVFELPRKPEELLSPWPSSPLPPYYKSPG